MKNTRIMVVDDEAALCEILQFNLESAGYDVDTARSAEEALALFTAASRQYALIILDVMMGGMSGYAMADRLRRKLHSDVPIIFLTAKDSEADLLAGFSAGGDDYITKPFSIHEVLARVKAILRRTAPDPAAGGDMLQLGDMVIDYGRKLVSLSGREVRLSPKEFGILATLARQPGRVFSRDEILASVWRGESCVLDRTVDVHIARVRRKLGAYGAHITNRQGYGYCWD